MRKLIALGFLGAMAGMAAAQTTPSNPSLLSPPLSPNTPGAVATASDTGMGRGMTAAQAAAPSAAATGGKIVSTQSGQFHPAARGRHRPR